MWVQLPLAPINKRKVKEMDARTLVLDTSYQPLGIISWERAMTLWCKGYVEIVEEYVDLWIHSARQAFKVPSIIRFVKNTFKKIRRIKFSRENVFARDKGKCQYCGTNCTREDFTLDHVVPRAMNGKTSWENVVVCCIDCNRTKKDKPLHKSGMKLLTEPVKPKNLFQTVYWNSGSPESWKDYLASALYWYGELKD